LREIDEAQKLRQAAEDSRPLRLISIRALLFDRCCHRVPQLLASSLDQAATVRRKVNDMHLEISARPCRFCLASAMQKTLALAESGLRRLELFDKNKGRDKPGASGSDRMRYSIGYICQRRTR
jgi:hypothetical protein